MGGGILLPRNIRRDVVRNEGRRLGYRGSDLDDFVAIIRGIDDFHVEVTIKRTLETVKANAAQARARQKR